MRAGGEAALTPVPLIPPPHAALQRGEGDRGWGIAKMQTTSMNRYDSGLAKRSQPFGVYWLVVLLGCAGKAKALYHHCRRDTRCASPITVKQLGLATDGAHMVEGIEITGGKAQIL